MTTHMLDTNVCVELVRRRSPRLRERVGRMPMDETGISAITIAELRTGAAKSLDPDGQQALLDEFLVSFALLPFDALAAYAYGWVRADLEARGKPIGPLDMLIASHALSLGLTLVTNNEREFRRVPGLKVENWLAS